MRPALVVLGVAVRPGRTGTALTIDGELAAWDVVPYPATSTAPPTVRRYAYRDGVRWALTVARDLAVDRGRRLDVLAIGEPPPPHQHGHVADLEAARLVGFLEGMDPDPARLLVVPFAPGDGAADRSSYPAAFPHVCRVAFDVAGAAVMDSRLRDLFG